MHISAFDLQVFMTVATEGSVTGGASRLGLTQPSVTRTLQKLEQNLGATLFIRSRKGVTLTRAGKRFTASTKRLLSDFEHVSELMKAEEQGLIGIYTIGVHSDLAGHTLPKFVAGLLRDHPQLELRFEHDLSRNITKGVVNLEMEFGIVVNPIRYPDLTIYTLYSDQIGFWIPKGTSVKKVLYSDNTALICNPELTQTAKLIKQARKRKLFPNPRLVHTTNLHLIADLMATGAGVGILPATTARLHHGATVSPIPDSPVHKDTICLIYRHDMLHGTAGNLIKRKILEAFAQKGSRD